MRRYFLLVALVVLSLAACSPGGSATSPSSQSTGAVTENRPTVSPESTAVPTAEPTYTAEATAPAAPGGEAAARYAGPAWANLPLTNSRTGETFTLAQFAGKTVFLKPMATW